MIFAYAFRGERTEDAEEIAAAFREKFAGDNLGEMKRNYIGYMEQLRKVYKS